MLPPVFVGQSRPYCDGILPNQAELPGAHLHFAGVVESCSCVGPRESAAIMRGFEFIFA
jgi:hypothetical protein